MIDLDESNNEAMACEQMERDQAEYAKQQEEKRIINESDKSLAF